jgi:rod shape-determining protein MreC
MSAFDRAVRRIGGPLEAGVRYTAGWIGSFFQRWVMQARMLEDKERLEAENKEMKRELADYARLEEENAQLRRALQLRDEVKEDLLSAEVFGVDQSPFFRVVKINIDRGSEFVRAGMAVIASEGVVGRIDRTYDDRSEVLLITDPKSKIAVEVARTHCPGILEGFTEDSCRVRLIGCDDESVEGDLIQTSGVDDLFPKGRPVGMVTSVERKVDGQLLEVIPTVRFDRLDMVWVVLATAPDPDPLAGSAVPVLEGPGIQPLD